MKIDKKIIIIVTIDILIISIIPTILCIITDNKDWFLTIPIIMILIIFIIFNIYATKISTLKQKEKMGIKIKEDISIYKDKKKLLFILLIVNIIMFLILGLGAYNIV